MLVPDERNSSGQLELLNAAQGSRMNAAARMRNALKRVRRIAQPAQAGLGRQAWDSYDAGGVRTLPESGICDMLKADRGNKGGINVDD